jgi:hypothetical protein
MKKPELIKLIQESIKTLIEEKNKIEPPFSIENRLKKDFSPSETKSTNPNEIMPFEGVDNTCKNMGFCCKEKYTKKNTIAVLQNNNCMCPKRSIQVNCPK